MGDGYHSAEDLAAALSLDIRAVHQALAQLEIDGQLARQGQAYWTRARD
jgi:predicted Rossmann fold nucleotide-binding protein DprA/Smf involved in DNA uptake